MIEVSELINQGKLQVCDEIIEAIRQKNIEYLNITRLIAMPPPKTLPSGLDFVNALMPPKKGRNVFV